MNCWNKTHLERSDDWWQSSAGRDHVDAMLANEATGMSIGEDKECERRQRSMRTPEVME
jgi:hypothetical protein